VLPIELESVVELPDEMTITIGRIQDACMGKQTKCPLFYRPQMPLLILRMRVQGAAWPEEAGLVGETPQIG
jgi:hypothetical protein